MGWWRDRKARESELKGQLLQLQATVTDILQAQMELRNPKVNPYPTYGEQVAEISSKYDGRSERGGGGILANIIDVRAAFISGQGIKAIAKEGMNAERELEWLKSFMAENDLEDEVPQDLAREAEIEGKILLRLIVDQATRTVQLRWIPWSQHGYTITTADEDYASYTQAQYRLNKTGREITLRPEEFVYARLGGRCHRANETPPKAGRVLRAVEALDKALIDWREINHLFAAPTPHFKVKDWSEAQSLFKELQRIVWKIGQFICTTADFTLVGPSSEGVNSLSDEITCLAKLISGATGVPVHFLGLPDLMSNRATADNLMEMLWASTSRERKIWIGTWEEVFQKALALANEHLQGGFNPNAITAAIPEMSASKMKELAEVWLPIRQAGEISRETFLAHIPELDVEEETKRLDAEKAAAVKAVMAAMDANGDNHNAPPLSEDSGARAGAGRTSAPATGAVA